MLAYSLGAPGTGMYIVQPIIEFTNICISSIEFAINLVVNRHEILRSSIEQETEDPHLITHDSVNITIEEYDWSDEESDFKRRIKLREFLRRDREKSFDFGKAPLLRPTVIKVTESSSLLILSHHHLLLDGTSSPIIAQEITTIYQAKKNKQAIPQLQKREPFSSYVKWLLKRNTEADRNFWKHYLKGYKEVGSLPCELKIANHRGLAQFNKWTIKFEQELIAKLDETAIEFNVTLSSLFLSAISIASSRYSSSNDFLMGLLLNGRPYELDGSQGMVGMFMNTLPYRARIDETEKLSSFIQSVHEDQLEIIQNQYISINQIRSFCELGTQTELIRCIFDNKIYLTKETQPSTIGEKQRRDVRKNEETSMSTQSVPLHYNLESTKEGIEFTITYDQRLIDSERIVSFAEFVKIILGKYSTKPSLKIGDFLGQLTSSDRDKLDKYSKTRDIDIEEATLVHELFYEQVKRNPDGQALVQKDNQYTYNDVFKSTKKIVSSLRSHGINSESVVALYVDRNPELVFLIIGLLDIGATFVPIDQTAPIERIAYILEDSSSSYIITSKDFEITTKAKIITLKDVHAGKNPRDEDAGSELKFNNERTAYILYTSGSTGKPKGIRISQRVLVSRLKSDSFPIKSNETLLSKTSCSFVDFYWEIFYPLIHGSTCNLLPLEECKSPRALLENLEKLPVKRIVLVPSLLGLLLEEQESRPYAIEDVELWFSTGEPLTPDLAVKFYKLLPNSRLFNLYGASEVWDISIAEIPKDVHTNNRITAGRPIANTEVYIFDSLGYPAPYGMTGDIYVSGRHIADGYQQKALNDESFVNIDFLGQKISAWKTGDRGYFTSNGDLIVQGRNDTLVKLRGFRVDLNEIEITAKNHPAVLDCAVTLINEDTLSIAILQENADSNQIRAYIKTQLPTYMVPTIWRLFDEFPYLSSGKIDRKRIQTMLKDYDPLASEAEDQSLLSDTDKLVLKYAKQYLSNSSIDQTTNFFEAGGHSLLAVRLLSTLSTELDKQIPLEAIFSNPVISDLSSSIDAISDESTSKLEHLSKYEELSPLSLPQKRLWVIDSLSPGTDTYILSNIISVPYEIEAEILKSALKKLQLRHASLRTKFIFKDGEPYQIVDSESKDIDVQVSHSSGRNPAKDLLLTLNSHSTKWKLSTGPLFYTYLCQSEGCSALGLKIHHIISDGVSIKIFFDELLAIYLNIISNKEWSNGLKELPLEYRDYAIWQHDWSLSSEFKSSLEFWEEKFFDRPLTLSFFNSSNKKGLNPRESLTTKTSVGPLITRRLRRIAKQNKTSMFNLLVTIYGLFLSRHVNEQKISIGTPITGRTNEKLEGLIGFFVDILVYPLEIDEEETFSKALNSTKNISQQILQNSKVPFDQIVKHLAPDRDELGQPLFQAMIVHEVGALNMQNPSHDKSNSHSASDHANYDYLLLVRESRDHLEITHHVRASLFSPPVLQAMSRRFNTLLSRLGKEPDRKVADISMLPGKEFNQIAHNWNKTNLSNPYKSDTVFSRFLNLVTEAPEVTCIYDEDGYWTRKDIHNLTKHYVGMLEGYDFSKSRNVCICMPKSSHQVAIVLALACLNLVFVPIDPNAPETRKQSIISLAKSNLLICTSRTAKESLDVDSILNIEKYNFNKNSILDTDLIDLSSPSSICYICFTSGSTGTPKGVCVSHFNLISLFHAHSQYFRLTQSSRVLSTLGFYFDAGIGEQIRPLLTGSCLYFSSNDLLRNPDELVSLLQKYEITHVGIPPSVLQVIDPAVSVELSKLQVLVTAGEALPSSTAKIWGSRRTIITGHGATETTIGDTVAVNWNLKEKPPLGRPLPNMKAYILNKSYQLCPSYVVGELALTGPQVTMGYLNEPDKTADRFLDKIPLLSSPYQYYLTGDQAYYDKFGILHFIGRTDYQLKIRGYRIEPGEIEVAACSHAAISGAVCTAITDDNKRSVLCLYYTKSASVEPADLQIYLEKTLPPYMVPTHIIPLELIPTTTNGKVNYRALPEIKDKGVDKEIIEAKTKNEKMILEIWKSVLKLSTISVESRFFAIGGDSIQAIQLLGKCKKQGLNFTPSDLYKHQTIRGLAKLIDKSKI